jgi:hypothetical protein
MKVEIFISTQVNPDPMLLKSALPDRFWAFLVILIQSKTLIGRPKTLMERSETVANGERKDSSNEFSSDSAFFPLLTKWTLPRTRIFTHHRCDWLKNPPQNSSPNRPHSSTHRRTHRYHDWEQCPLLPLVQSDWPRYLLDEIPQRTTLRLLLFLIFKKYVKIFNYLRSLQHVFTSI